MIWMRKAAAKDVHIICSLYEILFREMAKLQPLHFQDAVQERSFLESVIANEHADILLAVLKEEIAGFALVQEKTTESFSCFLSHRYAYLMDLVVKPEARGKGIGTFLVNGVKEWARERNLEYMELNVLSENTNAIQLYEREKFQENMKIMRCHLGGSGNENV